MSVATALQGPPALQTEWLVNWWQLISPRAALLSHLVTTSTPMGAGEEVGHGHLIPRPVDWTVTNGPHKMEDLTSCSFVPKIKESNTTQTPVILHLFTPIGVKSAPNSSYHWWLCFPEPRGHQACESPAPLLFSLCLSLSRVPALSRMLHLPKRHRRKSLRTNHSNSQCIHQELLLCLLIGSFDVSIM